MRIRLTRKLADRIDGVDVSPLHVGQVIELSNHDAELLLAEGWAVVTRSVLSRSAHRRVHAAHPRGRAPFALAADAPQRVFGSLARLDRLTADFDECQAAEQRRVEDIIRDELHESRAKTIGPLTHRHAASVRRHRPTPRSRMS